VAPDMGHSPSPQVERSTLLTRLHADLLRLNATRANKASAAFDRLRDDHHRLIGRYVELLLTVEQLQLLVLDRVDTEPEPRDRWDIMENPVDRWISRRWWRRPLKLLGWPLLVLLRQVYMHASERGVDRLVIAVRPLVRIFVGTHIRRSIRGISRGYGYASVTLDPRLGAARQQAEWLRGVRADLGELEQQLPTWRSTANALLGIPLVTTIPGLVYAAAGTQDLPDTILKFGPLLIDWWWVWIPGGLYFLSFVSWSFAYKRHLFLGPSHRRKERTEYPDPIYALEVELAQMLGVHRRREPPLDLLFASLPFIFAGAQSIWLPFSGLRNGRGEPAPITGLWGGLFVMAIGLGNLLAVTWRKQS